MPGVFIPSPGSRPSPGAFVALAAQPGARKMAKPWDEFEAKAAEAAADRAAEWSLPQQWGPPVRCVFLGPAAAGGAAGAAGGSSSDAERPPIGYQEKVRFRWTISAPDVPSGVAHEGDVAVQANRVFSRGIPLPAAWDPALKYGAQVQQALAKARKEVPDYVCRVCGLYRGTPAAAAVATAATAKTPGPRTGEKWIFREPNGVRNRKEVWVAAHHAANVWWCVKAPVAVWRRRWLPRRRARCHVRRETCAISLELRLSSLPFYVCWVLARASLFDSTAP